jgi:hypothetical protein
VYNFEIYCSHGLLLQQYKTKEHSPNWRLSLCTTLKSIAVVGCYYNNIKQKNTHPIGTGSRVDKPIYLSAIPFVYSIGILLYVPSMGGNQLWIALSDVCMAYPLIELSKKLCEIVTKGFD